MICGILLVCIIVFDLKTPGQFNLPILYGVPLVSMAWLRSRKALWGLVPILLLCNYIGWHFGEAPTPDPIRKTSWIIANRFIAAFAVVFTAFLLDLYFGIARDRDIEIESSKLALSGD